MSAPNVCLECSGSGWTRSGLEGKEVFYLCECRTKGAPFPEMCRIPGCRNMVNYKEIMFTRYRAEWDADADAEAWGVDRRTMEAVSEVLDAIGIPKRGRGDAGANIGGLLRTRTPPA